MTTNVSRINLSFQKDISFEIIVVTDGFDEVLYRLKRLHLE
jgi:hypothetical protein